MKKNTLVSIIMPVYNAEKFLTDTIQGILSQTHRNWELIAVDDGSTDKSLEILISFAKQNPRIKVFKNSQNLGIGRTINMALAKTKGDYIARQDADDVSHPSRLEKQLSYFENNPTIGVLGTFMREENLLDGSVAQRIVPTSHEGIKKAMFISQSIQNPSVMIARKRIPQGELWFDGHISPVDELDFFFRLLNKTKFANIPQALVVYRRHGNNSSLKNIKRTFFLTFVTRMKAVLVYGYRPGIKEFFIHWAQTFAVFILPSSLLYSLFKLWKEGISLPSVFSKANFLPQFLVNRKKLAAVS